MPRSLTKTTGLGIAWLLAQAGGARIIGFFAQIALARLLRPNAFGDVALASSIAAVFSVIVGFGVDDVLLSRSSRFRIWLAAGLSVALCLSILGVLIMVSIAPVAARFYHSPDVFVLLLISAISLPFSALSSITEVSLRLSMRFRFLASYATVELIAIQAITILLASRGCGAVSFVIPLPLAALVKALVFWRKAHLDVKWRIRRAQCRVLLHSGSAAFGQKLLTALRNNGDYMLLGAFASHANVGLYFMAFRIAALPVYAFANSLTGVLSPALVKLRIQPARQRVATLRASQSIALVVIPLSFLQAALARPFFRACFSDKWIGAAPLLSILSIGLAFDVVPCVAGALMSANGQFRRLWYWTTMSTPFFFVFVFVGCLLNGAEGVAVAVTVYFVLHAPLFSYFALRSFNVDLKEIAGIFFAPAVCSAGAVTLGMLASGVLCGAKDNLKIMAVTCVVSAPSYLLSIYHMKPATARDAVQRVTLLLRKSA